MSRCRRPHYTQDLQVLLVATTSMHVLSRFSLSSDLNRPPGKIAYLKIISQPKHMLWVLKRTVSFGHPKHMFESIGKQINAILGAQTILIWTYVEYKYKILILRHPPLFKARYSQYEPRKFRLSSATCSSSR